VNQFDDGKTIVTLRKIFPFRLNTGRSSEPQRPCSDELTMAAYAEGSLLGEEKRSIQAHLANCARCRAFVGLLIRASRNAEPMTVPGDLLAGALRISHAAPERRWIRAGSVAAVALAAIVGSTLLMRWNRDASLPATRPSAPAPAVIAQSQPSAVSQPNQWSLLERGAASVKELKVISPVSGSQVAAVGLHNEGSIADLPFF
jgi:hypothetical protein